jgi:hypothetical protein
LPLSLLTGLSASGVILLGTVFLSGFLSRLVREVEGGSERASGWTVARTLPWGRLIGADLLVGLLVVVGLIALVIPGLAAIVFFSVVGPVIEIENRPVIAALRRSAHLVRRHFWAVALLVVLPLAVAHSLSALITGLSPGTPMSRGQASRSGGVGRAAALGRDQLPAAMGLPPATPWEQRARGGACSRHGGTVVFEPARRVSGQPSFCGHAAERAGKGPPTAGRLAAGYGN